MGCFNNSPLDHHDIPWKPWMMSGLQAMWKKWPKFRGLFRVCGKRGGKMWSKHVKTISNLPFDWGIQHPQTYGS